VLDQLGTSLGAVGLPKLVAEVGGAVVAPVGGAKEEGVADAGEVLRIAGTGRVDVLDDVRVARGPVGGLPQLALVGATALGAIGGGEEEGAAEIGEAGGTAGPGGG